MERTGAKSANKFVAGNLIATGKTPDAQVQKREPTRTQSLWERPKQPQGTYAQQYLHAYNSRWMMKRDSAMSTYNARKSVMSRLQDYPVFLQRNDTPARQ